jgi:hypothetical protein
MKKVIFLIYLLLYSFITFAQNQPFEKKTAIQLNERAAFYEVNKKYQPIKDTIFHSPAGFILNPNYDIHKDSNGDEYLIFTYPAYKCKEGKKVICSQYIDKSNSQKNMDVNGSIIDSPSINIDLIERINGTVKYRNGIRLAIKRTSFDLLNKTKFYSRKKVKFSTGILTVPFKLRPKKDSTEFTLSTDVTIGAYAGLTFRLSKTQPFYLTIPFTVGLSFININDNNTNNTQPQETTSGIVPGITWSTGVIFQLSDFNIGFVLGQDFASGVGDKWMYNGEAWFSFAIGYNFLKQDN